MAVLQNYGLHRPTAFDSAGAFLPDQQDWLLVPVYQTRDSGPLDLSNFATALELLGGESDSVQVHRFGHWGPGWYEIIVIDPTAADKVAIAEGIADRMEDYPVLDEEDWSSREWEDFTSSWDVYAAHELRCALVKMLAFEDDGAAGRFIDALDNETLREWYMELASEPYFSESSGVCIPIDRFISDLSRETLASFLRNHRGHVAA